MSLRRCCAALNYGLRNALDNPYNDTDTTVPLGQRHSYGGYYVSNLTTALLGDASKGLGVRSVARRSARRKGLVCLRADTRRPRARSARILRRSSSASRP